MGNHLVYAIDARIKDIAVHSEAVLRFLLVRFDGGTETVKIDVLA